MRVKSARCDNSPSQLFSYRFSDCQTQADSERPISFIKYKPPKQNLRPNINFHASARIDTLRDSEDLAKIIS